MESKFYSEEPNFTWIGKVNAVNWSVQSCWSVYPEGVVTATGACQEGKAARGGLGEGSIQFLYLTSLFHFPFPIQHVVRTLLGVNLVLQPV